MCESFNKPEQYLEDLSPKASNEKDEQKTM